MWRPVEESDANSSRETNCGGGSDCEADRRAKSVMDGLLSQPNLMNLSSQQMNRHSLRERTLMNSSGNETGSSHGKLIFEYFEYEQPHNRKPLIDKASSLVAYCMEADSHLCPSVETHGINPQLHRFQLLHLSFQYLGHAGAVICCLQVGLLWLGKPLYPIYRIPMGPTLRDLDASFLTFHNLSTKSRSICLYPLCVLFGCDSQLRFHGVNDRNVPGVTNRFPKVSLPVFGLASYKLKGSILTPIGPYECQQESSLLKAADNWIQGLQIVLPDYKFFHSHYVQR
ncbi:unnamed protein product [Thlaspi arvense]|uniref:Uncharacterized protein n=1 Tax=Thlaspi arvense TaxID=13288 RepID=A0AAU9RS39_THLAR|nr:unnamed protein product [Thlaspi arvense]